MKVKRPGVSRYVSKLSIYSICEKLDKCRRRASIWVSAQRWPRSLPVKRASYGHSKNAGMKLFNTLLNDSPHAIVLRLDAALTEPDL